MTRHAAPESTAFLTCVGIGLDLSAWLRRVGAHSRAPVSAQERIVPEPGARAHGCAPLRECQHTLRVPESTCTRTMGKEPLLSAAAPIVRLWGRILVPKVRFELTRGCPHRFLRPARLPFRHFGLDTYSPAASPETPSRKRSGRAIRRELANSRQGTCNHYNTGCPRLVTGILRHGRGV